MRNDKFKVFGSCQKTKYDVWRRIYILAKIWLWQKNTIHIFTAHWYSVTQMLINHIVVVFFAPYREFLWHIIDMFFDIFNLVGSKGFILYIPQAAKCLTKEFAEPCKEFHVFVIFGHFALALLQLNNYLQTWAFLEVDAWYLVPVLVLGKASKILYHSLWSCREIHEPR